MTQDLLKMFTISGVAFGNLVAFLLLCIYAYAIASWDHDGSFGPRRLLIFASLVCAIGTYLFANQHLPIAQQVVFWLGLVLRLHL